MTKKNKRTLIKSSTIVIWGCWTDHAATQGSIRSVQVWMEDAVLHSNLCCSQKVVEYTMTKVLWKNNKDRMKD